MKKEIQGKRWEFRKKQGRGEGFHLTEDGPTMKTEFRVTSIEGRGRFGRDGGKIRRGEKGERGRELSGGRGSRGRGKGSAVTEKVCARSVGCSKDGSGGCWGGAY